MTKPESNTTLLNWNTFAITQSITHYWVWHLNSILAWGKRESEQANFQKFKCLMEGERERNVEASN